MAGQTYKKGKLALNQRHNIRLVKTTFVDVTCKDPDGNPLKDHAFELILPDGRIIRGKLDKNGHARQDDILPGDCDFKLIFDPSKPPPLEEEPKDDQKTVTIKLKLEDDEGTPFGNCKYILEVGEAKFEGMTTEQGVILHDVPREVEEGQLTFWPDADDEESFAWPLRIRDHVQKK